MTEVGEPFGFFNPPRHGKPRFSSSSSIRTRMSLPRTTTSFPQFSQLPFELRTQITKVSIQDAAKHRNNWCRTQSDPVVLQSRRGVLYVQPKPPTLAQLACVSKEWQEEIEKKLFKTLSLTVFPDPRLDEGSDLTAFAAIVTGSRRRYLSELKLNTSREYETYLQINFICPKLYHLAGPYEFTDCIVRLCQTLGTWDREEVAAHLLKVNLQIKLQHYLRYPLENIINLPNIPVIGQLHTTVDLGRYGIVPLPLLCLLRKLPELRSGHFYFNHRRFSFMSHNNHRLEVLMERLHSATPKLKQLTVTLPSIYQQPGWRGARSPVLTGPPVLSLRELSHRLQRLILDKPIDLSLFFKDFHLEVEDVGLMCSSWPELQYLKLQGSIVEGNDPISHQEKDWFLKVVGRAARRMPKLQYALIKIESGPTSTLDVGRMVIKFQKLPCLAKSTVSERFRFSVTGHTPSSSAVSVWNDTFQYTKRLKLIVDHEAPPYLDVDGEPGPALCQV